MTKIELARIACAVAIHRPDWPEHSLRSFLERHLAHRPYLDVAVALTWVAADPDSQTPARVLEAGPWWQASRTSAVPTTTNDCADHPLAAVRVDSRSGVQTCAGCWADSHTDTTPVEFRRTPPTDDARAARRELERARTDAATPDDATTPCDQGERSPVEEQAAEVL